MNRDSHEDETYTSTVKISRFRRQIHHQKQAMKSVIVQLLPVVNTTRFSGTMEQVRPRTKQAMAILPEKQLLAFRTC